VRDSAGRVTEETDPLGNKTTATYDTENGDRLTLRLPKGNVPGGSGFEWELRVRRLRQPTTVMDPTGRTFLREYTARGRLWKDRRPDRLDEYGQVVYAMGVRVRRPRTGGLVHRSGRGRRPGRTTMRGGSFGRRCRGHRGRLPVRHRSRLTGVVLTPQGRTDDPLRVRRRREARSKTLPGGGAFGYVGIPPALVSVTDPVRPVLELRARRRRRVSSIVHPGAYRFDQRATRRGASRGGRFPRRPGRGRSHTTLRKAVAAETRRKAGRAPPVGARPARPPDDTETIHADPSNGSTRTLEFDYDAKGTSRTGTIFGFNSSSIPTTRSIASCKPPRHLRSWHVTYDHLRLPRVEWDRGGSYLRRRADRSERMVGVDGQGAGPGSATPGRISRKRMRSTE